MNVGDAIDDSSLAKGCKTCSSVNSGQGGTVCLTIIKTSDYSSVYDWLAVPSVTAGVKSMLEAA